MLTIEDEYKIRAIVREEIQAIRPPTRRTLPSPHPALSTFLEGRVVVTVAEVVEGAMGVPPSEQGQGELTRAARMLAALGWERKRTGDRRTWQYHRPAVAK